MKALVDFENSFDQVTNISEKEMMLEFNENFEVLIKWTSEEPKEMLKTGTAGPPSACR